MCDGQLASLKCRSYEKMMKFLGNLTKQPKLADHQKKHDKNTITNQLPGLISQQECQRDQTKLLLPTDNRTMELPTRPCGRSTVKKQLQRTTGQTLEKPRNRIQP